MQKFMIYAQKIIIGIILALQETAEDISSSIKKGIKETEKDIKRSLENLKPSTEGASSPEVTVEVENKDVPETTETPDASDTPRRAVPGQDQQLFGCPAVTRHPLRA